jgi:hypothetical protein
LIEKLDPPRHARLHAILARKKSERSAEFAKRIRFPMTRGEGPEAGSTW